MSLVPIYRLEIHELREKVNMVNREGSASRTGTRVQTVLTLVLSFSWFSPISVCSLSALGDPAHRQHWADCQRHGRGSEL